MRRAIFASLALAFAVFVGAPTLACLAESGAQCRADYLCGLSEGSTAALQFTVLGAALFYRAQHDAITFAARAERVRSRRTLLVTLSRSAYALALAFSANVLVGTEAAFALLHVTPLVANAILLAACYTIVLSPTYPRVLAAIGAVALLVALAMLLSYLRVFGDDRYGPHFFALQVVGLACQAAAASLCLTTV